MKKQSHCILTDHKPTFNMARLRTNEKLTGVGIEPGANG
jgi:hypothetical protein